ncbi:MAG: glutathione S-transferase family protein [Alphaproteobacteria bacterium]|nr:glutathione S-transferase family protein [Alphaproteobacteria bacterium]MDP6253082.1 glutathione S-transferase family protein [Alphaproteobacteria bacterium]MDP7055004.1 glutathione S-transferase family protein [Alphaproteobacteria bacterium]MDP7230165.1 glutathione S-transferase family protein [Alphaproteobacteria bacterium]MDP7460262.1 glutathione S-transferase family protein [Alphaproteobacteria bacterium]
MDVTLYESGTSRSSRCRWTLLEAGITFNSVARPNLSKSDKVKILHPLGKLPVAVIDNEALFESAAICTYLADHTPDVDLIAAPGSWGRALHDQWTSFALTEMEAWLWNTAVNKFVLPTEQRIEAGFEQNAMMYRRAASMLNDVLLHQDYLVEERFTVTDIIVGWTVNWGRRQGLLEGLSGLSAYLDRLFERPHCAFAKD